MLSRRYSSNPGALVSGAGLFMAVLHTNFLLAWVCMVPLFVCLEGQTGRAAGRMGLILGATLSACSFWWMIPGAETFTGNSVWYGVVVFLICSVLLSAYWVLLLCVFTWLRPLATARFAGVKTAALVACLWVVAEAGLQYLAQGMPWFLFHTGNALAENLVAIQPLAWTGIHGATAIVVGVNYGVAHCIRRRAWKGLVWPLAAGLLYMGSGAWMLRTCEASAPSPDAAVSGVAPTSHRFTLSILSENIPPDVQWDSTNGNVLVGRLLALDSQALALKPDMVLWSESAIPWTYSPDDDLVREILRITAPAKITHVLGMNTAYAATTVYNSVYCLRPDGTVAGRYDKRVLLSLIEKPLGGWLFPFFSSNGYAVREGVRDSPLPTPFGRAGVLICNESTVPSPAADMARHGARFLLNLSNDGWFSDTYLVSLHFLNARLRAVETRKDIAINANNGYSGLIRASGRIESCRRSDSSFVTTETIHPNNLLTPAVAYPHMPVYVSLLLIILLSIRSLLPYYKP